LDGSEKRTRLGTGPPPAQTPLPANVPAAGMPAAPAPVDPLVGQVLAERYFVERKLGEGGMGSVYLATHVALEKRVALKVLHAEFARKADLVERFLLEAKAASRIRHENVIDISDFGSTPDGTVFFAMEFLEGKDLHEVLARAKLAGQPFPWSRARGIFLQVCAALSAAHSKGIVHRDLKPENIYLIDRAGMGEFVKLLDFGIAKVTEVNDEEGRKLTRTGMLFGTPEYMSPEQARGEKADHRVDVYAMGCILHQLVTGDVPFRADNFMGILSLHLTEAPPPITAAQLGLVGAPAGLAGVVARALAKDREQRFHSIDEMAQAILDAEAGIGVEAPAAQPAAPLARPKRTQWTGRVELPEDVGPPIEAQPPRRGKGIWIGLGLVAAAGAAVAIVLVTRSGGATPPAPSPSPTETPAAPATTQPDTAAGIAPSPDHPAATPTGPTDRPPVTTDRKPPVPRPNDGKHPVATDKPPVATDKPPVTTDKPPVTTDKPPVTTDKPPDKPPEPDKEPVIGDPKLKDPFANP